MIIVNGWKPLTIFRNRSILDVAAVLDAPLNSVRIRSFAGLYVTALHWTFMTENTDQKNSE